MLLLLIFAEMNKSENKEALHLHLFEKAYRAHLNQLEHYAFCFLGDKEEANSVVHDVFIRFWKNIDKYSDREDMMPLLLVTTKNLCINSLKKKANKYKYEDYLQYRTASFNLDTLNNSNATGVYEKEVRALITDAINSMPPKVKETYCLSRLKNLKNKEIAEIQHVSISSVEYRIASATSILQRRLRDYLPACIVIFLTIIKGIE